MIYTQLTSVQEFPVIRCQIKFGLPWLNFDIFKIAKASIKNKPRFSVIAENDIHIVLSATSPADANASVKIVLGGWKGSQSVIRNKFQGEHLAEIQHTKGPVQTKIFSLKFLKLHVSAAEFLADS